MGSFQSVLSSLRSIPNPLKGVGLSNLASRATSGAKALASGAKALASGTASALTSKPAQTAALIVGKAIVKNEIRSIRRAKPSFLNRIKQKIKSRKNNNVGNIELSNMNQQPQPQPQPQQQQQQSEPKQTAGNKKKPLKKETTPPKKEKTSPKKETTPSKKETNPSKKETNPTKKEKKSSKK